MTLPLSDTIAYWKMPVKGAKILCALSGGRDSVAMLHSLLAISNAYPFSVAAMHVNHRLRGAEADRDEKFCLELCERLGVEFVSASADVTRYAEENSLGVEQAAREVRYNLLETYAKRLGCTLIATAHTADDNAETVIFNLIRGSNLAGLCGIPPVRGNIIRPLIECTRAGINSYIKENSLDFVEDSTNSNDIYTRNKIRHSILPRAYDINPDFAATLSRNMRILRSQRDIIALAEAETATRISIDSHGCHIDALYLENLPPALAGSAVLTMGEMLGVKFELINTTLALSVLTDKTGKKRITLPGGVFAFVRDGTFTISSKLPAPYPPFRERKIYPGGYIPLADGGEIICESVDTGQNIHNSANIFYLDCTKINSSLTLRPRTSGDRLRRNKSSGSKSLKKLMIEAKIPIDIRDALVVVADGENILAAEGIGVNSDFQAKQGLPALKIEIRRRSYNDK